MRPSMYREFHSWIVLTNSDLEEWETDDANEAA